MIIQIGGTNKENYAKTLRSFVIVFLIVISFMVLGHEASVLAHDQLDNERVLKEISALAHRGDASAQFQLGNRHANGNNFEQDDQSAFKWYKLAAQQGHTGAQVSLAGMYLEGRGITRIGLFSGYMREIRAHLWLSIASALGDKDAVKKKQALLPGLSQKQVLTTQKLTREWLEKSKIQKNEKQIAKRKTSNGPLDLESLRVLLEFNLEHNKLDFVVERAFKDIELSHGGMIGRELFRQKLGEVSYRSDMARALNLGGVFLDEGQLYCSPAIICAGTDSPFPIEEMAYVLGPGAYCYGEPDKTSKIVEAMKVPFVRLVQQDSTSGWYMITLNHRTCFAPKEILYPALGYRVLLRKVEETWWIEAVLAGD